MKMSPAALPPQQPLITEANRRHPLFPEYQEHRQFCIRNLIQADEFTNWLAQRERERHHDEIAQHPRFAEFQQWMRDNQGGARRCPAGSFPANFQFWLEGGRW